MSTELDLWDPNTFAHAQRLGNMFAQSVLIPQHMRGKLPDVTIALMMAKRLNEDPLVVMQNIYVVSGKAGWSAQYIIARANRAGIFKGRINWREAGKGDDLEVTAFAKLAETEEEVSFTVGMKMARAEGWTKNEKYKSMPQLMLRYRSATLLVRLYAPEVMLGIPTVEEVEDTEAAKPARVVLQPVGAPAVPALEDAGSRAGQLAAILDAEPEPEPEPVAPAASQAEPTEIPKEPTDEKPAPAPLDPAKEAQLATIEALEKRAGGKGTRRARTAADVSPNPQLKRMGQAKLDAYQQALQAEIDEAELMGGDQ